MDKLEVLKQTLKGYARLCVAFSGGADSALLLAAALDALAGDVFAIIADGVMLPRRELREALALAEAMGATCHKLPVEPLGVPAFKYNEKTRCYHCKNHIFTAIRQKAAELGADCVADGANADDAAAFRPGQRAAKEMGVVSPLMEAGLTKADVRAISKELGLPTWDKPSASCLATRLPYGTALTPQLLASVEAAEELLLEAGVPGGRARLHGDILRVEAPKAYFELVLGNDLLITGLKRLGFKYITLDLEGFRSGSMD